MDCGRLEGKVALITGAARGQGAAEARLFVSQGAAVMLTDILTEDGEAVAKELGDEAAFTTHDVTDEQAWADAVGAAVERFGRLDILVNNAGIVRFAKVQHETVEMFRRVIDINLVGVFLGMKAATSALRDAGGGSIVNISSTSGLGGTPGTAAYVASKFAVRGLTKAAAIDLGPYGIRVNSVHPGSIDTPMIRTIGGEIDDDLPTEAFDRFVDRLPIKRLGTPDDVAQLVLFLASDESSYCTGAEFVVDGGQTTGDLGLL
ncbi:MAG: glucose 1-dehydrogenase [Actinobacteria bacterium]|nr:glucose 1-dehydrogenase [Actinomycetota bacterium]